MRKIEMCLRFVEEQDIGTLRQADGESDDLALPSGLLTVRPVEV